MKKPGELGEIPGCRPFCYLNWLLYKYHRTLWPGMEQWSQLLPARFVQRCAPEVVANPTFDVAAWQRRWQAMSPEEKVAEAAGPWRLSNWLYYFDPSGEGMGGDR